MTSQGNPRRFGRKGEWRGHREGVSGLVCGRLSG